jgi:2-oxoisovalerate dehydrogenase E1 component alpha subunit
MAQKVSQQGSRSSKNRTDSKSVLSSKSNKKGSTKSKTKAGLVKPASSNFGTKKIKKINTSNFGGLSQDLLLRIHDLMVKSRVLEERVIKIYKAGEGYFWIGGPGEEAFGIPLGLLARKGQGLANDWFHLHYRCTPTLIALGMPMIDAVRLMMNRVTDPSTGGRNFAGHYCFPKWNVAPVTSPIEVQYPLACGTAHAQKRAGFNAISIVTGGDAGTAEGDFASSLVWSSRKGNELPILITVQNNGFGISTPFEGQHGETQIADRARAFNIRSRVINGNDPIESYLAIKEEMEYIRKTGKPSFIEVKVTRLYGHSSADGANRKNELFDSVLEFEKKLKSAGLIKDIEAKSIWEKYELEGVQAQEKARTEPSPTSQSIWDHVFVDNENADWRKF